jgi:DNA polymerase III alpha subunit
MIASGETDGVFQLESAGMRQFLIQLKPTALRIS